MTQAKASIVLGSGSSIRARILAGAGITFDVVRPEVDETRLKAAWRDEDGGPDALALALAEAKAREVSARRPGALVIGADQILVFEGQAFDKATSLAEGRERLKALRGRTHELVSGLVLVVDGTVVDRIPSISRLYMRAASDLFLDRYLNDNGEDVLSSVGVYQFEGLGAQLFDRVEGDYFAILGLDLLPLLASLRRLGVVDE